MLPILPNHRTIESEHESMLYSLYSTRCVVLLSNWTFLLRKPVRFTVPRPQQYNMIDFEQKLDRLKVVVESTESFQLKFDVKKVEYMAIQLYYHDLDSARVVEHLPFENPPFVNLIDRQKKDVEDRKAIWKKFSDVYLSRLVAVNFRATTAAITTTATSNVYQKILRSTFCQDHHYRNLIGPPCHHLWVTSLFG